LVGYNYTQGTETVRKFGLFRGVIPYVIDDDNVTSLDFDSSYVTTKNLHSTKDYEVVQLFGREFVKCKAPN